MTRKIAILIGVVVLLSCSKKPLQVLPAENTTSLNSKGLIYALPRTVINIRVDATKNITVPGPYCRFAQKYMGISDIPLKKVEEWKITNIEIISVLESDPTALYAAVPGDKSRIDFLKIVNTGLIIPISGMSVKSTSVKNISDSEIANKSFYTDLSTSPFIASEKTTFYSKVQHDSVFVRVPIQKDMIIEKNIEEKARDAADFIFMLRKRRSDFLSVDADHNLNGEGLKIALDEINRLEQEYVSLFIGKSFTETSVHFFEYVPKQPEGESSILFRFSSSKGVLTSSDLSGNPILLKCLPEPVSESYELLFHSIGLEKDKPISEVIYYRIPISTNINISDGQNELLTRRLSIYQYGPLVRMPLKFMIKDSGLIEFSGLE